MPEYPDPTSMQRYVINSLAVAPDLGSIMVSFIDPAKNAGGPIIADVHEMTISLHDDETHLREMMWEIVDRLCDVIDESFKARRRGS